jgi:hypothetical protein
VSKPIDRARLIDAVTVYLGSRKTDGPAPRC